MLMFMALFLFYVEGHTAYLVVLALGDLLAHQRTIYKSLLVAQQVQHLFVFMSLWSPYRSAPRLQALLGACAGHSTEIVGAAERGIKRNGCPENISDATGPRSTMNSFCTYIRVYK